MKYLTITDQDCTGEVDKATWAKIEAVQVAPLKTHFRFNLRLELFASDDAGPASEVVARYRRCSAYPQETPEYSPWVRIQGKRNK